MLGYEITFRITDHQCPSLFLFRQKFLQKCEHFDVSEAIGLRVGVANLLQPLRQFFQTRVPMRHSTGYFL